MSEHRRDDGNDDARSRDRRRDDPRHADGSWRDQADGRYSGTPRPDRGDRSRNRERDIERWEGEGGNVAERVSGAKEVANSGTRRQPIRNRREP